MKPTPGPPPVEGETWIAIKPPGTPNRTSVHYVESVRRGPPSFESAQFDVVLRRQHQRRKTGNGPKTSGEPSRYLNLSHTFDFAGWGTLTRVDLITPGDSKDAIEGSSVGTPIEAQKTLGQFTASSVAGAAVLGSIFYALPVVFVVSSVFSPISLFVATLTLFIWRPIMEELASALPMGGAPYSYLLNVSSKTLALIGAAALLLDYAATAVVSAATAATYLDGEVNLPFPHTLGQSSLCFSLQPSASVEFVTVRASPLES
ncbi:hypothetical protein NLI96_g11036 [Meripilus lineatus]|uniref:Uncharacterized protein n=1 Tax=Meripilus lineatus TaxID=2056292 RepID=A0AAD5Y8S2_9APHY|nr:hypothetical protein NLI96_g11036 [Physisporinus lineatus]